MRGGHTETYKQYVGHKIREARKTSGLSHDRLAAAAGMDGKGARQHLIKLEQGKHLPREQTLRVIAEATGREVGWFLPPVAEPRAARIDRYRKTRERLEDAA